MELKKRSVKQQRMTRSATQRVNDSVAKLKSKGGARKTWRLSPDANKALSFCLDHGLDDTETALINRLILAEKRRLEGENDGS